MKTLFTHAITLFTFFNLSAQCLTCKQDVRFALDANCQATITMDAFTQGQECNDQFLMIMKDQYGRFLSNPINGYDGMIVYATLSNVTQGIACTSRITLEDKTAPLVDFIGVPDPVSCQDDWESLVELGVVENCGSYDISLVHEFIAYDDNCDDPSLTLVLQVTDNAGNSTTVTANTTIYDFCLDVTAPEIVFADCSSDISQAGRPVFGSGVDESQYATRSIDILINPDQIRRKWLITESACNRTIVFEQTIFIQDTEPPVIEITDFRSLTFDEYENNEIHQVYRAEDACGNLSSTSAREIDRQLISCAPLVFAVTYELKAVDRFNNLARRNHTVKVFSREGAQASIVGARFCVSKSDQVGVRTANMVGSLSYSWNVTGSGWHIYPSRLGSTARVNPGWGRGTITVTVTDEQGCAVTVSKIVNACMRGRSEKDGRSEVSVHPSLANDYVSIENTCARGEAIQLICTDATGKSHINENIIMQEKYNLNVSQLPRGIYFLTIVSKDHKSIHKIYKQ